MRHCCTFSYLGFICRRFTFLTRHNILFFSNIFCLNLFSESSHCPCSDDSKASNLGLAICFDLLQVFSQNNCAHFFLSNLLQNRLVPCPGEASFALLWNLASILATTIRDPQCGPSEHVLLHPQEEALKRLQLKIALFETHEIGCISGLLVD